jgi:DNA-binding NarL/FixJ family response regulator
VRNTLPVELKVLLVEDDTFTRTTLTATLQFLGFTVVDSVSNAEAAMAIIRSRHVDVLVTDLDLGPGPTGIDIAFGVRGLFPETGIVILTSFGDPRLLSSSIQSAPDFSAYVVKQSLSNVEILKVAICGSLTFAVTSEIRPAVDLTNSQIETLRLLAYGLSNAEIARVRVVTEKSVEQAISRAAKRLNVDAQGSVNQRVALAREYFRLTGATRHTHAHR